MPLLGLADKNSQTHPFTRFPPSLLRMAIVTTRVTLEHHKGGRDITCVDP